jgi:hypothetical protein
VAAPAPGCFAVAAPAPGCFAVAAPAPGAARLRIWWAKENPNKNDSYSGSYLRIIENGFYLQWAVDNHYQ